MVRLFVRHNVRAYAEWRKVYDEFDAERRPLGVIDDAVFQSIDNPNDVTVWHDFDSAADAQSFATSEAIRGAMERSGVTGEPQVWFVTPA